MPADRKTLEALRERVRKAEGPDRELDEAICLCVFPGLRPAAPHCVGDDPIFWDAPFYKQRPPKLTASIDAAVALVERVRPGWDVGSIVRAYSVGDDPSPHYAVICAPGAGGFPASSAGPRAEGCGNTRPLAILDALLSSLITETDDVR